MDEGAVTAGPGQVQSGVDPRRLRAGSRRTLGPGRLAAQKNLLRAGAARHTPILVTQKGCVVDGHHGARAAADLGMTVSVRVVELDIAAGARIVDMPLRGGE